MVSQKAVEVLNRLIEQNKKYNIKILGDEANKEYAIGILMETEELRHIGIDTYSLVSKKAIDLLKEAEIEFEIV